MNSLEHGGNTPPESGILKEVRRYAGDWERLPRLGFGNLILDTETRCILVKEGVRSRRKSQQLIHLRPFEMETLRLLLLLTDVNADHGRIISPDEFQEWVDERKRIPKGGADAIHESNRSELNTIYRLKKKISELEGCSVELINNSHHGFQLVRK